eukprot:TRINITY_DN147_c0_g3_i2.p1 TRINITY_DN147_c0_g3~~TRINITY_DN147_c0_g3_i2.p1  ORF type:complete len:423 (+),score=140.64 TRINITY_DN147_c0_g3_i2:46-1314(+)
MPAKKNKKKKSAGARPPTTDADALRTSPTHDAADAAKAGYAASSVDGCFISVTGNPRADRWLWGAEELCDGLEDEDMPEISFDPSTGMLSAVNVQAYPQSFTISVTGSAAQTAKGRQGALSPGSTTSADGTVRPCITFMAIVPACTILDLCKLKASMVAPEDIDSDIQKLSPHADPDVAPLPHHRRLVFPLGAMSAPKAAAGEDAEEAAARLAAAKDALAAKTAEMKALKEQLASVEAEVKAQEETVAALSAARHHDPATASPLPEGWLCTQEQGAGFTHHFAGNHHAVDFRTGDGDTLVLSATDGVVTNVSVENTVTGVHVSNYFKWNSISIAIPDGGVAEYVHLHPHSARVKVGDTIKAGDPIALSGAVGFCPEPHLHFQLLASGDSKAASLPFTFAAADGGEFIPHAGAWYTASGRAKP